MNYDARIKPEVIDELVAGREPNEVFGHNGILDRLRQALVERFARSSARGEPRHGNDEDLLDVVEIGAEVDTKPDPASLGLYRKRFNGFEEKFTSLFARGLNTGDIRERLSELYGVEVTPGAIAAVTSQLEQDVVAWQSRALEILYPIVVFEAVRVKSRSDSGAISHKTCHFALGFHTNGAKEILGLWIENQHGEPFWRKVLLGLRSQGAADILIFVNAASGFREAALSIYPGAQSQSCIVELIRSSLDLTSSKNRSPVSSALKEIYEAPTQESAWVNLKKFADSELGALYPAVAALWLRRWSEITPFFALPIEIRRVISTLFAREVLLRSMVRMLRACGEAMPDEETLARLFLVVRAGQKLWKRPQREWHGARAQFAAIFPDRFSTR